MPYWIVQVICVIAIVLCWIPVMVVGLSPVIIMYVIERKGKKWKD
jgi:hypothetical protein